MTDSDVFLLLTKQEAYGVVFAEAMGSGLVVIGRNTAGAVHDFHESGAPLFSVEPRVTEDTARLITRILTDLGRLMRQKREAHDWSKRHLGWDRYVDGLEEVLRRTVASRRREPVAVGRRPS